jgi:asparagine synthase (glutamine-hydrolysing)
MCGIAGVVGPAPDRRALLEAMSAAIAHRGPDEAGHFEDDQVMLAIRRLSIIDVGGGHQPYVNESGTVHAVFNGEIYGYRELRQRLERAGHRFMTHTDGEVIVHAYEEYGGRFIEELDGMFAFALWDAADQRLVLARDRLGKKPLFVAHHPDGSLSFASELAPLLLDARIKREVDLAALGEYLHYGYVPSPHCIIVGVTKLEPGMALYWRPSGKVERHRYWALDYEPKLQISYAQALDEFEERARLAVQARLVSDVPVGVFLSGGIDSSYVLAQMGAAGASRIETFSIGFPDPRYDEREHARAIAQHFGSVHHDALVEPTDLVELLPRLVHHYGEPFADSSAVPSFYLARMARKRITVALTGEGGDETFGGYYRHQAVRLASALDQLPAARRAAGAAATTIGDELAHPMSIRHKTYRALRSIGLEPGERYAEWTAAIGAQDRRALFPHGVPAAPYTPPGHSRNALDQALAVDIARSLPDRLLYKMDIATMASSLEARAPLLDYRLVEWTARLPRSFKQRGRERKRLISDALARHIPESYFKRPKMGFSAPIPAWLRGPLSELTSETLLSQASRDRGIADPATVERLVLRHRSGEDHTQGLWAMLMLELWFQEFVDRTPQGGAWATSAPGESGRL